MWTKTPVETVLERIEKADLATCSNVVEFINSLDFLQYSPQELKCISDTLSERIKSLIHL